MYYLFYSTYLIVYIPMYIIYIYLNLNLYITYLFSILYQIISFNTAHVHWILRSINLTNYYFLLIHWSREENFELRFTISLHAIIHFHKLQENFRSSPSVCLSLLLLSSFSHHFFFPSYITHLIALEFTKASPFAFRSFCLIPFINRSCSFLKLHYTLLLPREDVVHVELSCCIVEFLLLTDILTNIQYQWNSYQFLHYRIDSRAINIAKSFIRNSIASSRVEITVKRNTMFKIEEHFVTQ